MVTTEAHIGETGKAVLSLVDAQGRPTTRVENVVWTNSDPAVVTVEDNDANPLDAIFTVTSLGTSTIGVSVDADMGEGVTTLAFSGDLSVVEGDAASGTFTLAMDPVEPPA